MSDEARGDTPTGLPDVPEVVEIKARVKLYDALADLIRASVEALKLFVEDYKEQRNRTGRR